MIKVLNCIAYVAMVAVNIWVSFYGLNGYTTEDVSSLYPTLFTPAGFTFSIWFIIYIALAGFCIYQFKAPSEYVKGMSIFFIISCLLNVAWLFTWHYLLINTATLIMAALLITLIIIYRRIRNVPLSKKQMWALKVPFSVYLGWVTVAFISNIAVFLTANDSNEYPEFFTILMITASFVLAVAIMNIEHDLFYGSTICWALIGIMSKYWRDPAYENIVITAAVGIILIVVSTMVKRPQYFQKAT